MMGSLLTEYLGSPQQHIAASESNSEVNAAGKKEDIVDGAENNDKSMDSLTEENDNGESQQWETNQLIIPLVLAKSWKVDMSNAMRLFVIKTARKHHHWSMMSPLMQKQLTVRSTSKHLIMMCLQLLDVS